MKTLKTRIEDLNIKMVCKWGNREEKNYPDMDPWTCKLTRTEEGKRYSLTTPFFMGYEHGGKEPSITEVLGCLLDDSASIENSPDFEEWAREYVTDPTKEAKKLFRACEGQMQKLQKFLDDHYEAFLWETEN